MVEGNVKSDDDGDDSDDHNAGCGTSLEDYDGMSDETDEPDEKDDSRESNPKGSDEEDSNTDADTDNSDGESTKTSEFAELKTWLREQYDPGEQFKVQKVKLARGQSEMFVVDALEELECTEPTGGNVYRLQ